MKAESQASSSTQRFRPHQGMFVRMASLAKDQTKLVMLACASENVLDALNLMSYLWLTCVQVNPLRSIAYHHFSVSSV